MLLQQLGPTYVKIGQMIASRGDVLPADIIAELSKLQSDAAPFPWEDARAHHPERARQGARRSCSRRSSTSRSPRPRPPRSTGRRSTTGRLVAVKVQRPQIIAKTKADLGVITELASIAERRVGIARKVGLRRDGRRVRRRRPQGARLHERGVPREAARGQHGEASPRSPCRAIYDELSGVARAHDGLHLGDQGLERGGPARGRASTPTPWAPRSSGRSSSRSSSTGSSTATRTRAT